MIKLRLGCPSLVCQLLVVGCAALMMRASSLALAEKPTPQKTLLVDSLPYGSQAIDYHSTETDDAVSRLARRLKAGDLTLGKESRGGYLRPLLAAMGVPLESQLLVFSKTALHPRLVGPENPRALYFNDEVSVAWVPGAEVLEIASIDPKKGALFYTLKQTTDAKPQLQRETRCLACHVNRDTFEVPGLVVRSFITDHQGNPKQGLTRVTHETGLSKRWAGWYLSGAPRAFAHLGNRTQTEPGTQRLAETLQHTGSPHLEIVAETSRYLTGDSDIVAHLVFHHQCHGQNLLIRVGYEARLGRPSDALEQLLRYLLFVHETPLPVSIGETSRFADWFARQGQQDAEGRSLRQFDLKQRLFKYRLSYLIETRIFDQLPPATKRRFYDRLWEILSGQDRSDDFRHLPRPERQAIIEILRATKTDLPEAWFRPVAGECLPLARQPS